LWSRWKLIAAAVVVLLASVIPTAGAGSTTLSSPTPTVYYVALGDSLSTGGGAGPGLGYVNDIYATVSPHIPGLQLVNLGCAGDSTTRMIHGGNCQNYKTGNQLGDAEAFLRAHTGHVAFVTIDVGGDDVVGCAVNGPSIDQTCVANALTAVRQNMQTILSGLRSAGGAVPIVGMNYYDPILAAWYQGPLRGGPPSPTLAHESLGALHSLNDELATAYGSYGARVANVKKTYESNDWTMTGAYMGHTLPQNVANICNWTHMCMTGPGNPNIHATAFGHSLIAADFEKVLRVPATISGVPPAGSVGVPYSFQYTAGGYPSSRVTRVGKLPRGLSLSSTGLLFGTPSQPGSFTIAAKATDSAGTATNTQVLVIS
jgi:lysophospholipase L1-like esterase